MNAFARLFSSDPSAVYERAQAAIVRGDAHKARSLADKLRERGELLDRLDDLEDQLKALEARRIEERARKAWDAGRLGTAAEDLAEARDMLPPGPERDRVAADLERLRDELRGLGGGGAPAGPQPDIVFQSLLATLRPDVAQDFAGRPAAFRNAWLALNDGKVKEARAAFEAQAEAQPDDGPLRLLRAQVRLMTGDLEGAERDLEWVWEHYGDEPLDQAGQVAAPMMWSEIMLARGEHEAIVDNLKDEAQPGDGHPALSLRYGLGLVGLERFDEAVTFFGACVKAYPREIEFRRMVGLSLARRGDTTQAIDVLEEAIAPSCEQGRCGTPALHPETLSDLASLYIKEGKDRDRARRILGLLAQSRGGKPHWSDLLIQAEFMKWTGDPEGAAAAIDRARELAPPRLFARRG